VVDFFPAVNSDGSVYTVLPSADPSRTFEYSWAGILTPATDVYKWYNRTGSALLLTRCWLSVGTAPTGSKIIADINRNGTTIFTDQTKRPVIEIGNFVSSVLAQPDDNTFYDGDYITFDLDQVGSGVAGSNLIITAILDYKG
jgi:hypothetical protein